MIEIVRKMATKLFLDQPRLKCEARISKFETISNDQIFPPWRDSKQDSLEILKIRICLGFRYSNFGFMEIKPCLVPAMPG